MKRNGMIVAVVLAFTLLFTPPVFGKDIEKGKADPQKKAGQIAPKELPEQGNKGGSEPKAKTMTPEDGKSAAKIKPVERLQTEPLSASAVWDKGRQIKWQIICASGNCGNSNVRSGFGSWEYLALCGSVGQVAVGPGSSPSFGVNSGYWQEFLGRYVRGDCNGDGVVSPADVVHLINYFFRGGPAPDPMWVGDCNCDEVVGPGDVIYLLNYLFRGWPAPSC